MAKWLDGGKGVRFDDLGKSWHPLDGGHHLKYVDQLRVTLERSREAVHPGESNRSNTVKRGLERR